MDMARQSDLSTGPGQGIPVLVTRPREQAEGFARKLTSRFGAKVRPLVAPLMTPEYLAPPIPDGPFSAVIFTSARGVEGARRLHGSLPRLAYCVGRSTASAASAAGYEARSSDGDVEALAAAILADPPKGRLLYIRGVDTAGMLENTLVSNGIPTVSLQVYLQIALPLEGESLALLRQQGAMILPLFSPRSARIFRDAMPNDARAALRIAAMSEAVARAASDLPHTALTVAARPDADAMLDAVESLLAAPPMP